MKHKKSQSLHRSSFERSGARAGYLFILPWLIGFLYFFCKPFLQAIRFSFSTVSFPDGGGIQYDFVGLQNYIHALRSDPEFLRSLVESLGTNISNIIIILFFSFFIAMILNSDFRGRTIMRGIFFLPVIIASGAVIELLNGNSMASMLLSGSRSSMLFEASSLQTLLSRAGMPEAMINTFMSVVNGIFNLSWQSGVQILLFLAGLQSIPKQLYEAANVEGATAWEKLWRLTFPMMGSIFLLNTVYTVINEFSSVSNQTMQLIMTYLNNLNLGSGAAMAIIYFIAISLILGAVYLFIRLRGRRSHAI